MRTAAVVLGIAWMLVFAPACGGGRRPASRPAALTQDITPPPRRVEPLSVILGALGAHQSPAQLAPIAAFIRRWELDPFAPVPENDLAMSTPAALMMWLTQQPDITVTACMAVQTLAEGHGADVGPVVTMGSTFGMAAYLIEHPGASSTSPEVQTGGIESALRWYAASLRRGDAHNDVLDELAARYASGGMAELLAWWTEHGVVCGDG